MAFPSSPTNGQLATVNGIIYQYGSAYGTWTRVVGSIGNLTTNNLSVIVNSTIGSNQTILGNLYIGSTANATSFTNPIFIGVDSGSGYVQAAIVNTFGNASADFTAYANNGTDVQGWMDMGMTGNVFNDSKYTITGFNDGYIFANGVTGNSSLGGNLVIATGSGGATNDIVFATGGFLAANEKMRFSNATSVFRVSGTITTTGITSSGNATVSALTVNGAATIGSTLGVTGNVYTGNLITTNGVFWANGTAYSSGGGGTPGGANTYVQFNDGSTFGGNANFTFNKTTGQLLLRNNNVATNYVGNTAPSNPLLGDSWYYPPSDKTFKYNYDGTSYQWVDQGAPTSISFITVTANAILPSTPSVSNIGTLGSTFNTVHAKATSAQYADLAENYLSNAYYKPGTVVVFGGTDEITTSNISHDYRVAGVISTEPAYLMNAGVSDSQPVALTGRVPCFVVGNISKGDRLVNSEISGVATKLDITKYEPGCIIGKSLENYNSMEVGVIEIAVGRF